MLSIVATPIGNLEDITLRALNTLKSVDEIICEDTRRTSILLNHYQIKKPLIIFNDFTESRSLDKVIDKLKNGLNLALVSDAGTPLISDPGFKLVRKCLEAGIEVDSLPGASAVTTALTLSCLPPDKYMFLGYFPDKVGHRKDMYQKIRSVSEIIPTTFIIFVAPFKIIKTIEEMQSELGDLNITLAKELTKINQNIRSKQISQWLEELKNRSPKGEYVMLFRI